MTQALLMEFPHREDIDPREQYVAVLRELGDVEHEAPDGAISHVAAISDSGEFVVFEQWESREAQERFLRERLGPALEKAGSPPPNRMVWLEVVSSITAGSPVQ